MKNHMVAYVHAYVGMGRNAGGETTIHDMMRHLVENDWDVTAIVSQPAVGMGEYYIDGVHVIPQVDKRTVLHWVPRASMTISHLDNAERTIFVSRKFKTPSCVLAHSDHPIISRYVALEPSLAVFNTEWVRDVHLPYCPGPNLVVHPAVDGSRYKAEKTGENLVTMVNLWPHKGSNVFWEAAKRLPDIKFLAVIGGYGDQDIRELDNVEVIENTPDMASVYARSGIVIMPSRYESYGRIAVEAASQGIPSIVADTPGLREAMGPNGIYVQPSDDEKEIEAYVAGIKRLQHWKSHKAASNKMLKRFAELDSVREVELEAFRVTAESIANTARQIRGW